MAVRGGAGDGVGEVELPLGVVGLQAPQVVEDGRSGEGVDAGVDQPDRPLLRGGVLEFDDALEDAGLIPLLNSDHPTQRARVRKLGHGHGAPPLLGRRGEPVEGARLEERHVAGEDEHGGLARDLRLRLGEGMAGPPLLGLEDPAEIVTFDLFPHPLGAMADHDQDARAPGGAGGVDHPLEERPAGGAVEDLGEGGFHARPLAGGEDHGDSGAGGHGDSLVIR